MGKDKSWYWVEVIGIVMILKEHSWKASLRKWYIYKSLEDVSYELIWCSEEVHLVLGEEQGVQYFYNGKHVM